MKRTLWLVIFGVSLLVLSSGLLQAQDHGEIGVFADYLRLQTVPRDLLGVGGRLSLNVHRNVQLEAEMAYDFERAFAEVSTNGSGGVSVQRSQLRVLNGLFGPKLQMGNEGPAAIRAFVTVKGGFINFSFSNGTPLAGFTSAVDELRRNNVNGVLYPGGGVEGYLGPIGLRLDVGDEIYFNNGAHHNLRLTFGPHIRF